MLFQSDFPAYLLESRRLSTFDTWPAIKKPSASQLSDAGFFYTQKTDHVICFSCGGGLYDWEENDNPWRQHALWFGQCEFLQLVKGQEYIDRVKADFSQSKDEKNSENKDGEISSGDDSKLCKICYIRDYNIAIIPCGHVVACARCISVISNCPICRKPFNEVIKIYFS